MFQCKRFDRSERGKRDKRAPLTSRGAPGTRHEARACRSAPQTQRYSAGQPMAHCCENVTKGVKQHAQSRQRTEFSATTTTTKTNRTTAVWERACWRGKLSCKQQRKTTNQPQARPRSRATPTALCAVRTSLNTRKIYKKMFNLQSLLLVIAVAASTWAIDACQTFGECMDLFSLSL